MLDPDTVRTPNPFLNAEVPAREPPVQAFRPRWEARLYHATLVLIVLATAAVVTLLVWTA